DEVRRLVGSAQRHGVDRDFLLAIQSGDGLWRFQRVVNAIGEQHDAGGGIGSGLSQEFFQRVGRGGKRTGRSRGVRRGQSDQVAAEAIEPNGKAGRRRQLLFDPALRRVDASLFVFFPSHTAGNVEQRGNVTWLSMFYFLHSLGVQQADHHDQ